MAAPPTSRRLFHYTTGDGLVSIIKSQTLHATHSDFLNDPSECRLIKGILHTLFQRELREILPQLFKRGVLSQEVMETWGLQVYSKESENILRSLFELANDMSPFFISSFCLHEPETEQYNHGLLSQWRGYARGGFALEFDERELDELVTKELQKHANLRILTDTVSYENHEERTQIGKIRRLAKAIVREMAAKANHDISDLTGKQSLDKYLAPFVEAAPFLKDPSFREESEFRLVAVCFRPKVALQSAGPRKKIDLKTRSNNTIVPYVELFGGFDKLPIKSVIVGPHPNQNEQCHAVELLLERFDVAASVRVSRIPFRG